MHLGQRVRNLREMRGVGLNELARAADVSPGYLSQLESGQRGNPSVDVLQRIARGLGVTAQYFLESVAGYEAPPLVQDEDIMLRERKYAVLSESDKEDIDELLNVKWRRQLASEHQWVSRLPAALSEQIADLIALYGLRAVLEAGDITTESEFDVSALSDEALLAMAKRAAASLGRT